MSAAIGTALRPARHGLDAINSSSTNDDLIPTRSRLRECQRDMAPLDDAISPLGKDSATEPWRLGSCGTVTQGARV